MKTRDAIAACALTLAGLVILPSGAGASDGHNHGHGHGHHHGHNHDHGHDHWHNRRKARRAGALAGIAAAGIAGAAARDKARDHYRECMDLYAGDRQYEAYCREEYYHDQRRARRTSRRVGVVTGLTVREIVRD